MSNFQYYLFSSLQLNRKCCQSNSASETATRALDISAAPQSPFKVEEETATEASVEDKAEGEVTVTDAEAEESAAASSYTCCGVF